MKNRHARLLTIWSQFVTALCLISPLGVHAQGPQGGFGGGMGGGMGGGRMGNVGNRDSVTGTSILSPGDFGEWPITAKDDETIIVYVASTNFDPVTEIVDAKSKQLATNDDVRPGEQNSLLLYHFSRGGEYRIHVKAAKQGGAGQYQLTLQRFVAKEAPLAARVATTIGATGARWLRFDAQAGDTLVVTARASSFSPRVQLFGPNGERIVEESTRANGGRTERIALRAAATGPYFARVSSENGQDSSFALTVARARQMNIAIGNRSAPQKLQAGGLDLWTFEGKAGDLVRVKVEAPVGTELSVRHLAPQVKNGAPTELAESAEPLVLLAIDPKSAGDQVVLLNRSGRFEAAVSHGLGLESAYTIQLSAAAKPLQGADSKDTLPLGGVDFWSFEGKTGQIARFEGASSQFDTYMTLYGPTGEMVVANDDGSGNRNALITAILTTPGRYLLTVRAHGNGGSGGYTVRHTPDPVRAAAVGGSVSGSVGAGASEIWSFRGRSGQTLIMSARSSEFDASIRLLGPDGLEIAADDDGGEGTDSLLSIKLPVDGEFTVWVTPKSGGGKYSLQIIEAK